MAGVGGQPERGACGAGGATGGWRGAGVGAWSGDVAAADKSRGWCCRTQLDKRGERGQGAGWGTKRSGGRNLLQQQQQQGGKRDKRRRRACANYNNQDYNSNLLVSLAGCHSRGPGEGATGGRRGCWWQGRQRNKGNDRGSRTGRCREGSGIEKRGASRDVVQRKTPESEATAHRPSFWNPPRLRLFISIPTHTSLTPLTKTPHPSTLATSLSNSEAAVCKRIHTHVHKKCAEEKMFKHTRMCVRKREGNNAARKSKK